MQGVGEAVYKPNTAEMVRGVFPGMTEAAGDLPSLFLERGLRAGV